MSERTTITLAQWSRIHPDYKSQPGDTFHPARLVYNRNTGATEIEPVFIERRTRPRYQPPQTHGRRTT